MDTFDFVNRANAEYIDRLYQQYLKDPRSLEDHWKAFFAGFELGLDRNTSGAAPPVAAADPGTDWSTAGVYDLVHSYRELGHFVAKLDPLGHDRPSHPLLQLSEFGLKPDDLEKPVIKGGFYGPTADPPTLRELIESLRATYSRTFGVEFMDIPDKAQREWLARKMEPIANRPPLSNEEAR